MSRLVKREVRTSGEQNLSRDHHHFLLSLPPSHLNMHTVYFPAMNILILMDPDAGKDWRLKEKGTTEDKMVGWHHWLSGREFEQAPGDGEGPGSLACCSPWGRKELDTTERLNSKYTLTHQSSQSTCFYHAIHLLTWVLQ